MEGKIYVMLVNDAGIPIYASEGRDASLVAQAAYALVVNLEENLGRISGLSAVLQSREGIHSVNVYMKKILGNYGIVATASKGIGMVPPSEREKIISEFENIKFTDIEGIVEVDKNSLKEFEKSVRQILENIETLPVAYRRILTKVGSYLIDEEGNEAPPLTSLRTEIPGNIAEGIEIFSSELSRVNGDLLYFVVFPELGNPVKFDVVKTRKGKRVSEYVDIVVPVKASGQKLPRKAEVYFVASHQGLVVGSSKGLESYGGAERIAAVAEALTKDANLALLTGSRETELYSVSFAKLLDKGEFSIYGVVFVPGYAVPELGDIKKLAKEAERIATEYQKNGRFPVEKMEGLVKKTKIKPLIYEREGSAEVASRQHEGAIIAVKDMFGLDDVLEYFKLSSDGKGNRYRVAVNGEIKKDYADFISLL